MDRAVLMTCLPWLGWLVASSAVLLLLVRLSRAKPKLGRLRQLHADEQGSAQSLSFVLTLPLFVMILLFIVQVSQLMIGAVVVHYAAVAAARAAAVWIPAAVAGGAEPANCISMYFPDPNATDQVAPVVIPTAPNYGPTAGGMTFCILPHPTTGPTGSPKYAKILSAAAMACIPISPSRNVGVSLSGEGPLAADIIKRAYAALAPGSTTNPAISKRIENKLAYAMANTSVELRFYHPNAEPPLMPYPLLALPGQPPEFQANELGWQDQIRVTVKHNLALLPGPGRLLARQTVGPTGMPDRTASAISRQGNVYTYPLEASAVICSEGEKSVIPYVYQPY
jgi:hypothetical protein